MQRENDERWWGGRVADGWAMPFRAGDTIDFGSHGDSQAAPLFVSSHGRVASGREPAEVRLESSQPVDGLDVRPVGDSLRDAVRWCAENVHHHPAELPDMAMFDPQWALWIELLYQPTQAKTLDYARAVLANGYRSGVIIIDDNWSEDYGVWRFRRDRFPDPRAMVDELHRTGFPVMVWVCPYVSPDGVNYLRLRDEGLLITDRTGEPVIRRWWNGYSAVLDLTNPATTAWFRGELDALRDEFGIDGFKFDGGDIEMYSVDDVTHEPTTPADQVHRYGRFAAGYRFNELRSGWKLGGLGAATRLADANHSWDHLGLGKLVGNLLAQGLLGMPFGAPDMIGGGQYLDFDEDRLDQELFVRHAQIAALSPMMQFSAAPWRVLDAEHAEAVRAAADIRGEYQDGIAALATTAATTGDPIVRPLEYEFPHAGLADVTDQFMVGTDLLVAPVIRKGATSRTVALPPGIWRSPDGTRHAGGGTIEVPVDLLTLPRFERL